MLYPPQGNPSDSTPSLADGPSSRPTPRLAVSGLLLGLIASGSSVSHALAVQKPALSALSALAQPDGAAYLTVEAHPENLVAQTGSEFFLAVVLRMSPQWHTYWNGFSDSGTAPRFTFEFSGPGAIGVTAGEPIWPAPTRHVGEGNIIDHIYEGEVALLIPIRVGTARGGVEIAMTSKFLVCKDVCIPGKSVIAARFQVGDQPAANPAAVPALALAASRATQPLAADSPIEATFAEGTLRLRANLGVEPDQTANNVRKIERIRFFPAAGVEPHDIAGQGESEPLIKLAATNLEARVELLIQLTVPDQPVAGRVGQPGGQKLGIAEVTFTAPAPSVAGKPEGPSGQVVWLEVRETLVGVPSLPK